MSEYTYKLIWMKDKYSEPVIIDVENSVIPFECTKTGSIFRFVKLTFNNIEKVVKHTFMSSIKKITEKDMLI